jgi:hypothetical protein
VLNEKNVWRELFCERELYDLQERSKDRPLGLDIRADVSQAVCGTDHLSHATQARMIKLMQVCFARGVGSPCSHAKDLAHSAQVCRSLQLIAWGLREPAHGRPTDRSWQPCKSKQAGRAHAMSSNCPMTSSAALALQASLACLRPREQGEPTPLTKRTCIGLKQDRSSAQGDRFAATGSLF